MQIFLVTLATIFAFIGNIPYLKDIWKGKIEPHAFSWFVWSIVSCIIFFGVLSRGGGLGVIPIFASEIFTILVFIFSLKNGFRHIEKVDILFLIIAIAGLLPWYLTSDPTVSVLVAVIIDISAFIPTIRKTAIHPKTENSILYIMNFCRHILILLTLDAYNLATTIHSIVMLAVNLWMIYLIKRKL